MVLERLTSVVRRGGHDAPAQQLYASMVRAARNQELYSTFLVPDTVDGRFDMLALHLFLLQNRVDGEPGGETVMQEVLERFVADMDQNLRQLGVGDPSMGREVRAMVEATHGRFAAYGAGLAAREPGGLETVLARNVYRGDAREEEAARALAAYVRAFAARLGEAPLADILAGRLPAPPVVSGGPKP